MEKMIKSPPKQPVIRILGIDPGATLMGWAVIEYDPNVKKKKPYVIIDAGLIKGEKIARRRRAQLFRHYDKRYSILRAIYDEIRSLIRMYDITHVISESAFMKRIANAFASLKLVIFNIRQAAEEEGLPNLEEISPKQAKFCISGDGTAKKDKVENAVKRHPKLDNALPDGVTLDGFTEHTYDAIAIGYTGLLKHLGLYTPPDPKLARIKKTKKKQ